MSQDSYDYDIAVIGGGSGGLACAKRAAEHGARVLLADFTVPGPHGATWKGLGGTCSHVGCVPKKYMHSAALIRASLHDGEHYGLHFEETQPLEWPTLIEAVQDKLHGSDWVYRVEMRQYKIDYKQWLVRFKNQQTLIGRDKDGNETEFTARYIVLAVGGRPAIPRDIPGSLEHCITSDDFFSLENAPGNTLCIGASYIALETAGVLAELGYKTSVMVRSRPLRAFDQDCAEWLAKYMELKCNVGFIRGATPTRIEQEPDGRKRVYYESTVGAFEGEQSEVFDTVVMAVGRTMATPALELEKAGVKALPNGKIPVDANDQTNVPNIFAIGDIRSPGLELTPVAIANGRILADRLFAGSQEQMCFENVASTIFTPIEYGFVGLSEERAYEVYGKDGVEVYLTSSRPFQWAIQERGNMFGKLIVRKSDDVIIGMHYVGPDAGEVTQGMAIAIANGVTKRQWDHTVTIHPTSAERMLGLTITRASGAEFTAASCCG